MDHDVLLLFVLLVPFVIMFIFAWVIYAVLYICANNILANYFNKLHTYVIKKGWL